MLRGAKGEADLWSGHDGIMTVTDEGGQPVLTLRFSGVEVQPHDAATRGSVSVTTADALVETEPREGHLAPSYYDGARGGTARSLPERGLALDRDVGSIGPCSKPVS